MIDCAAALPYTGNTCQGFNGRFSLPANSRYSVNARKPWQALGKHRMAAVCVSEAEMKEIPLSKGKVALVDDSDYEWLNQWKWHYKHKDGAVRSTKATRIYMHRVVTQCPSEYEVDHINHDRLDNRRVNLRVCSHSQNQCNSAKLSSNTSGYKGVSWHKKVGKWQSKIGHRGKSYYLGLFSDPVDAALAYDAKARETFGEFAACNFQEPPNGRR